MHRNLDFKFISVRSLPLVLFYLQCTVAAFLYFYEYVHIHMNLFTQTISALFLHSKLRSINFISVFELFFFFNPSRKMSQKELSTKFRECLTSLIDFSEQWHSHSKEWDRGAE